MQFAINVCIWQKCLPSNFTVSCFWAVLVQLLLGTGRGLVSMEARPGPQVHRWSNQQRDQTAHTPKLKPRPSIVSRKDRGQSRPEQLCWFALHGPRIRNVVDLERQLRIPPHITQSDLTPDIILVSEATRQLILLNLTVLWTERMEEAQERKRAKYQKLVEDCRRNGWRPGVQYASGSGQSRSCQSLQEQGLWSTWHNWCQQRKSHE